MVFNCTFVAVADRHLLASNLGGVFLPILNELVI